MTDHGKTTAKYAAVEFFSRLTGSGRGTRGISVEVGEKEAVGVMVTITCGKPIPQMSPCATR